MPYQVFTLPPQQPLSAAGRILPGSKASFFLTNSSTPTPVYTTAELDTTHTQPVEADGGGRFPTIYLNPSITYKVTVTDANDVLLYTIDPVNDDVLDPDEIAELLSPRTSAEISAGVTPVNYAYPPGDVRRYGATGDGVTDDTFAIQQASDALPTWGGILYFEFGTAYKIGRIDIISKNATVYADGAKFLLDGNGAGFVLHGTVSLFNIFGGYIVGDGVNRDSDASTAQTGWIIGNEANADVSNVSIDGVRVESANVGFKVADGRTGGAKAFNIRITNCQAASIIGIVGGMGYGYQFTQAPGSIIANCLAAGCERHGIYFSEGRDYVAANCVIKDHRVTISDGLVKGGMAISRSRNVAVSNCVFKNNNDVSLVIDDDAQGLAPDNILLGVQVSGCAFHESVINDIRVGTTNPSTNGVPYSVNITGNTFVSLTGGTNSSIYVNSAERLKITGNMFDYSDAGGRVIVLAAEEGATYSQDIEITDNQITGDYGVQIEAALITGTSRVHIEGNRIQASVTPYEFVGGITTQTNENLIVRRDLWEARDSANADTTPCVAGVDQLFVANSGATTITDFDGGRDGQVLNVEFGDANTTVDNGSNIFLVGGVDFVGSSNDILTLTYRNGVWREVARSVL
jgi:hypothetical protein